MRGSLVSREIYVYVGPYFECTVKPATKTVDMRGCTNTSCPWNRLPQLREARIRLLRVAGPLPTKFCGECGSRIGDIEVDAPDRPDSFAIADGALFHLGFPYGDVVRLAPQEKREGEPPTREIWEGDADVYLDIGDVSPQDEITWMARAFSDELQSLRRAYQSVAVKWGVCVVNYHRSHPG